MPVRSHISDTSDAVVPPHPESGSTLAHFRQ